MISSKVNEFCPNPPAGLLGTGDVKTITAGCFVGPNDVEKTPGFDVTLAITGLLGVGGLEDGSKGTGAEDGSKEPGLEAGSKEP